MKRTLEIEESQILPNDMFRVIAMYYRIDKVKDIFPIILVSHYMSTLVSILVRNWCNQVEEYGFTDDPNYFIESSHLYLQASVWGRTYREFDQLFKNILKHKEDERVMYILFDALKDARLDYKNLRPVHCNNRFIVPCDGLYLYEPTELKYIFYYDSLKDCVIQAEMIPGLKQMIIPGDDIRDTDRLRNLATRYIENETRNSSYLLKLFLSRIDSDNLCREHIIADYFYSNRESISLVDVSGETMLEYCVLDGIPLFDFASNKTNLTISMFQCQIDRGLEKNKNTVYRFKTRKCRFNNIISQLQAIQSTK